MSNARTSNSNNSGESIWGAKIIPGSGFPRRLFSDVEFKPDHPIFNSGELCPLTKLYGIPILAYSASIARGQPGPNDLGDNQPAVWLRKDPRTGFAPIRWQMHNPGTVSSDLFLQSPEAQPLILDNDLKCYFVRQDGQPLTKELLETMYQFHSELVHSDYFEYAMEGSPPYAITPAKYKEFAENYQRFFPKGVRVSN